MAGGHPKGPSRKPPPSSSAQSHRPSRWESAPSAAGTANHRSSISSAALNSSAGASSSIPKVSKFSSHKPNPSSDQNPTPNRGNPNPSPRINHHPIPNQNSAPRVPNLQSGAPYSLPDLPLAPPPPPSYGFHMLERRTIMLANGSTHTYLALPPDYQDFIPPPRIPDSLVRFPHPGPDLVGPGGRFPPFGPMSPNGFRVGEDQFTRSRNQNQDYWDSLGLDRRSDAAHEGSMKRKFGEVEGVKEEMARQRRHVLQYGNAGASGSPFNREDEFRRPSSLKATGMGGAFDNAGSSIHHYHSVDPDALKKAFLKFAKLLNDDISGKNKKHYLDNGKSGPLKCIACPRSSKLFPDVHALIVHAYTSEWAELRVDHLGLHKALCVLMGWNYTKSPDNSRAYQFLPAHEASANQDDLILWPPTVMLHNTRTGKSKDGLVEGMRNKEVELIIRGLGFNNFKPRSLYNKEGHLGIILIKFAADQDGLRQAIGLNDYFEHKNRGRRGWAQVQSTLSGTDDDTKHPMLVEVNQRNGDSKKILYGHLFTASDLDKADFETKKKAVFESKQDLLQLKFLK